MAGWSPRGEFYSKVWHGRSEYITKKENCATLV